MIIVVIAVAVIGLGILQYVNTSEDYIAGFDVPYASFGGDYQSYMYQASDEMVSALDAIAENIGDNAIEQSVNVAFIIIAIGLGILAFGLYCIGEAFGKKNVPVSMQQPTYVAPTYAPPVYAHPVTPAAGNTIPTQNQV